MLNVAILSWSGGELVAALAAKLCYSGASIAELSDKVSASDQKGFLGKLRSLGHESVFEHVSFSFGVEGVSRVLTHQLVRHRLASYSQQSQRYVRFDNFSYVTPPSISGSSLAPKYDALMNSLNSFYSELASSGIPAEDARYVLPNACETKIVITMNARELLHFFKLRCCNRAQWEIRELAMQMLRLVKGKSPTIFALAGPACVGGACSEGGMTCGKAVEVREEVSKLNLGVDNG
ncbi:FAD-dependent thymidylate synthase [Deferribacterales bacterium RsTz2092]|nr:flavin-dependent thymidylate synthase [Deferribacterales bacterium]